MRRKRLSSWVNTFGIRAWAAPILVLLVLAPSPAVVGQDGEGDPLVRKATEFCRLFLDGEYEQLHDRMDSAMQGGLTEQLAEQVRGGLLANGAVQRIGEPWLEAVTEAHRRYRVPVFFEKGARDLRVVFDGEGKVAGFFQVAHVEDGEKRASVKQKAAPQFTGHWEGSIETPGVALTVLVDLSYAAGHWSGSADIPMQGVKGLPLAGIRAGEGEIRFALADIPGDPTFQGKLADGVISGDFTQAGQSFRFSLSREQLPIPARPQEPAPPLPYEEREVSFTHGDVTLAGTLTFPREGGPFPAALLISGSGPQDRNEEVFDHKPFLVLSDHLTRAGIAVLRVDDRGVGGSTGQHGTSTSEDFAEDASAGVKFLRDRPEIDSKKIGLIGHSEGGIIAPLVASKSKGVAFVVLLAGPGVPGDEILYRQSELISRVAGMDPEQLTLVLAEHAKLTELIKSDASTEVVRDQIRKLVESQLGEAGSGSIDDIVEQTTLQMSSPWFKFFLGYDPRPALRKLRMPVLALNGELDLQVEPEQNLPEIAKALEKARNKDVTATELPGLNHLFQKATTGAIEEYYTIEETMNPAALETITDWILTRFGPPPES